MAPSASLMRRPALGSILGALGLMMPIAAGATTPPVWAEEFDSTSVAQAPDPARWRFEVGNGPVDLPGWGNRELQYYTGRSANLFVQDGLLHIRAVVDDPARPDGPGPTSARLMSRQGVLPRFGLFEVRAKLPCGRGAWPAIWMLGEHGQWPARGEIDIAEWAGASFSENEMQIALHDQWRFGGQARVARFPLPAACGAFHIYRLLKSRADIRVSVDAPAGKWRIIARPGRGETGSWPYDQPFQMILNVAVGGDLGGPLPPKRPARFELLVDYVRVYPCPQRMRCDL